MAGLEGRRGWERLAAEAGFEVRSWRHCCGADGRFGLLKRMKVLKGNDYGKEEWKFCRSRLDFW